jgi:hypothetical protein
MRMQNASAGRVIRSAPSVQQKPVAWEPGETLAAAAVRWGRRSQRVHSIAKNSRRVGRAHGMPCAFARTRNSKYCRRKFPNNTYGGGCCRRNNRVLGTRRRIRMVRRSCTMSHVRRADRGTPRWRQPSQRTPTCVLCERRRTGKTRTCFDASSALPRKLHAIANVAATANTGT